MDFSNSKRYVLSTRGAIEDFLIQYVSLYPLKIVKKGSMKTCSTDCTLFGTHIFPCTMLETPPFLFEIFFFNLCGFNPLTLPLPKTQLTEEMGISRLR